jgi:hypothetical protein
MSHSPHVCVVCNQPWPEGKYCYGEEQHHRQSAATGAQGGVDEATRDIEHLLFAALRVLNDETEDGTTEANRNWVMNTLLQYAEGACEQLKESSQALFKVTALYLWPMNPRARETAEGEATEGEATEHPE